MKFLTQSTWSHAALYVGERPGYQAQSGEPNVLLEAEAGLSVVAVPLSKYAGFHTGICRPVGLDVQDSQKVIDYGLAHLGKQYDAKRSCTLSVPLSRYRCGFAGALAIVSGDLTKALLRADRPRPSRVRSPISAGTACLPPSDFEVSPFFAIGKPAAGLD